MRQASPSQEERSDLNKRWTIAFNAFPADLDRAANDNTNHA
jgi:hypothetical protein